MATPVVLATHEWPAHRTDGQPAPLAVLVHGLTSWRGTWWRMGPALAASGWRVVAVDQRGHGHSPRIDGFATMADLTADLVHAVERLGPPADVILGHSLGAAVTVELAHARPELVRRIVLEDPPSESRPTTDPEWVAALEESLLTAQDDAEGEVKRDLRENPAWEEADARQDVEGRRLADRDGLLASFSRATIWRVHDLAATLPVPALFLLADAERSSFTPDARAVLEAHVPPDARIAHFDAGHSIHRDRFDEELATILAWLRA